MLEEEPIKASGIPPRDKFKAAPSHLTRESYVIHSHLLSGASYGRRRYPFPVQKVIRIIE
jgi:hypothetical protein